MTSIDYEEIFNGFLRDIDDYKFASKAPSDAYEDMTAWLHKAAAKPYMRNIFSALGLDDEIQMLVFEMRVPADDETDREFVCNVLAKGMIVEWLRPQVNTINATKQFFGGAEQKFYSQANHLSELRALLSDAKAEVAGIIRDRGAIYNSYLEGES